MRKTFILGEVNYTESVTGVKLDDAVKVEEEEEVVKPKKAKKVEIVEPEEGQAEGNPFSRHLGFLENRF